MTTAVACVAALGLLLFALGLNVSLVRGRTKIGIGFDANNGADPLTKAVRAHGNTAEFAPILAVLMLYLGTQNPAQWIVWTMIVTTVCRYLIVAGIFVSPTLDNPHPLRFVGALGTYLGGLMLSVAVALTVL